MVAVILAGDKHGLEGAALPTVVIEGQKDGPSGIVDDRHRLVAANSVSRGGVWIFCQNTQLAPSPSSVTRNFESNPRVGDICASSTGLTERKDRACRRVPEQRRYAEAAEAGHVGIDGTGPCPRLVALTTLEDCVISWYPSRVNGLQV